MTTTPTTEEKRRRSTMGFCEWCHTNSGDFDIAPPAEEYATLICISCYAKLHGGTMKELEREKEK
jgi:hypothetical protein